MSELTNAPAPEPPPDHGPRPGIAALGVGLAVGMRLAEMLLSAQAMAGLVAQVVLVEWGSARAGVAWSARPATTAEIAKRALPGLAIGLALGATVILFGVVTNGVEVERVPTVATALLGLGLVNAVLLAWRDELLLHGLALRALGGARPVAGILACAATSGAAALGKSDASTPGVVVAALVGAIFGALWVRDRGAWLPVAANVGFRFATGTLLAGGLVQTRVAANAWGGGDAGLLGGMAAAVALLPLASAAIVTTSAKTSPEPKVR